MKFIYKSLLVICHLVMYSQVHAQEGADAFIDYADSSRLFSSEIQLITRTFADSVVLRWAPDKPGAWTWGNKVGYIVERTEIGADSTINPETFVRITPEALKPWPLDDWRKIINPDDPNRYAATAAQALYGKGTPARGLYEEADAFKTRFSLALTSADLSPETATALGLRYVDKKTVRGKIYVYRVFNAVASQNYHIDTAYAVVHTALLDKLPQVIISEVVENEQQINLMWDRNLYDASYTAYYIERSEDGRNFKRLNEIPYINPLSDDFMGNRQVIMYQDSVPQNYKPYYYRIVGISPFGELSPMAEAKRAMGRDRTPPTSPENIKTTHLGGKRVEISWEKPVKEKDLAGFVIGRSDNAGSGFQPLFTTPLPPNTTRYIDESANEWGTNYYLVAAMDTAGNGSSSIISYAMILDSIPPDPPQKLTGSIDSTGLVTLTWALGAEPDLVGYRIFFSNAKDHVFTTVNERIWQDTVYTDTIQVKTLTKEIFYVVKAIDVNHNQSVSSDTLRLVRPDLIPPTRAVFSDYKIDENGVHLEWIPSSSDDALKYYLYRSTGSGTPQLVKEFPHDSQAELMKYTDIIPVGGLVYTYSLVVEDDAGLQSVPSEPLGIKMIDLKQKPVVENISVTEDTENGGLRIVWTYQGIGNYRFILYRAVNGGQFQTLQSIAKEESSYLDRHIKTDNTYEYVIKVQFEAGESSGFGTIAKFGERR